MTPIGNRTRDLPVCSVVHIVSIHLLVYRVRAFFSISCSYISSIQPSYTSQYIVLNILLINLSIYSNVHLQYIAYVHSKNIFCPPFNISCSYISSLQPSYTSRYIVFAHLSLYHTQYTAATVHQQTHTCPHLPFITNVDSA